MQAWLFQEALRKGAVNIPFGSLFMNSSIFSFVSSSSLYSYLPFASSLIPSDYGLSFVSMAASKAVPLLSSAASHLCNFIGKITTIFGGPGITLAIIAATSLTTTAIYFYYNWDRREELTREDYGKLALWVLVTSVSMLSIGAIFLKAMEYLIPEAEELKPDIIEGMNTQPKKAEDTRSNKGTKKTKAEKEAAKLEKQKRKEEHELEKLKINAAAQVEIAKMNQPKPQESTTLLDVAKGAGGLLAGAGTVLTTAGGMITNAGGIAYAAALANPAIAIGAIGAVAVTGAAAVAHNYRDAISDKIYGTFDERVAICVKTLKELSVTAPYNERTMPRFISKLGIAIDEKAEDVYAGLGKKIAAKYKDKDGDPVELFLTDLTDELTKGLNAIAKSKDNPLYAMSNELDPLEIYLGKIYTSHMLVNEIDRIADNIVAMPGNALNAAKETVSSIAYIPMEIAKEVAEGIAREQRIQEISKGLKASSIMLKTGKAIDSEGKEFTYRGIGVNNKGKALYYLNEENEPIYGAQRIRKTHVSISNAEKISFDYMQSQFTALDKGFNDLSPNIQRE